MENIKKNFLEKLQSSDDATKRRWMFGSTVVIMALVVYVWFAYFNNLVAGFGQPPADVSGGGFTFWQSMKNGTAMIYQTFIDKLQTLSEILKSPREYIVNPLK